MPFILSIPFAVLFIASVPKPDASIVTFFESLADSFVFASISLTAELISSTALKFSSEDIVNSFVLSAISCIFTDICSIEDDVESTAIDRSMEFWVTCSMLAPISSTAMVACCEDEVTTSMLSAISPIDLSNSSMEAYILCETLASKCVPSITLFDSLSTSLLTLPTLSATLAAL